MGTVARSPDASIAPLAARQFGAFTRHQACRLGFTHDMIAVRTSSDRWSILHPGVYAIAGSPDTWERRLLAACFAAGPGAVASHRSAGALWRLDGVVPATVEVTITASRRRRVSGVKVHRTRRLGRHDMTKIGPIPVTTPARTIIDLATVLHPDPLEEALDDVLRRELASVERVRRRVWAVAPPGRRGRGVLLGFLAARTDRPVTDSALETRFLRLLREAGLPEPTVHHRVDRERGYAVIDFVFEPERVAAETEGYRWYGRRKRYEAGPDRQNEITLSGYLVLRFTWHDVEDHPRRTIDRVRRALELRRREMEVWRLAGVDPHRVSTTSGEALMGSEAWNADRV